MRCVTLPSLLRKRLGFVRLFALFAFALSELLSLSLASSFALADAADDANVQKYAPNIHSFAMPDGGGWVPVYANVPLDQPHPELTRALIVVHGTERNAATYFDHALRAVEKAGLGATTLVLAVHFQLPREASGGSLAWNREWKIGALSEPGPNGRTFTSFEVLDELGRFAANRARFARMALINFIGHSAGGQTLQRYAYFNELPGLRGHGEGIDYRITVANPSTYTYPDAFRPVAGKPGQYFVPGDEGDGSDANFYRYGLEAIGDIARGKTRRELTRAFIAAPVTLLVGDQDTRTADLDDSSSAMLQGKNRYSRALAFFDYLRARYPSSHHRLEVVAGVGHDGGAMFGSSAGLRALFYPGARHPITARVAPDRHLIAGGGGHDDPPALNARIRALARAHARNQRRLTAKIVVIGWHHLSEPQKFEEARAKLTSRGIDVVRIEPPAKDVFPGNPKWREFRKGVLEQMDDADAVYFLGGYQVPVLRYWQDPELRALLDRLYQDGVLITTRSASTAALSTFAVVDRPVWRENSDERSEAKAQAIAENSIVVHKRDGQTERGGAAPRLVLVSGEAALDRQVVLAAGLDLLPHSFFEQHRTQRERIVDPYAAIAQLPEMTTGYAIDEDTALEITNETNFRVIGRHLVEVITRSTRDRSRTLETRVFANGDTFDSRCANALRGTGT